MLKKLIKYEFKASYRIYLPIYLTILGLSLILLASWLWNIEFLQFIGVSMMVLGIGGLGIFTVYNLIVAMGQRVYGKPGYLLFAIPTKTHTIIASKMITHFIWMFVTIIVFICGFTSLLFAVDATDFFGELYNMFYYWDLAPIDTVGLILALLSYMIYFLAFFMFLFALLNLIYRGPHKVLMGILLYFGLNTALSIFTAVPLELILFKTIFGGGQVVIINTFWTIFIVYAVVGSLLTVGTYFIINRKMELQ